jgi:hypothetical protein
MKDRVFGKGSPRGVPVGDPRATRPLLLYALGIQGDSTPMGVGILEAQNLRLLLPGKTRAKAIEATRPGPSAQAVSGRQGDGRKRRRICPHWAVYPVTQQRSLRC